MTADTLRALHDELGIPPDYAVSRRLGRIAEARPTELRTVATAPKRIELRNAAADAWEKMRNTAAAEGIVLTLVSGFRSIAYQAELIRAKLHAGRSIEQVLRVNIAPGFSEHHSGCALDLATPGDPPLEESFGETPAFRWLQCRAFDFDFSLSYDRNNPHGICYEPWHWLWAPGKTVATR